MARIDYTEKGKSGLVAFNGLVSEGYTSKLEWPSAYAIYDEMRRRDPTIRTMWNALILLARTASWYFEPAGDADEDKEARAQLWATRIEDDRVFMVRGPWNEDFIAEAVAFPAGANDDMVDSVSGGWQMCPGYVTMADVGMAPDVPSRWDPFGEMGGRGLQDAADREGPWLA